MVVAALIPPPNITFSDEDVIITQAKHGELFSSDRMILPHSA